MTIQAHWQEINNVKIPIFTAVLFSKVESIHGFYAREGPTVNLALNLSVPHTILGAIDQKLLNIDKAELIPAKHSLETLGGAIKISYVKGNHTLVFPTVERSSYETPRINVACFSGRNKPDWSVLGQDVLKDAVVFVDSRVQDARIMINDSRNKMLSKTRPVRKKRRRRFW